MANQLNIILLTLGIAQGGILSIWFFRNKKKHIANVWFAAFLIAVGLQLTLKVITKVWMMENVRTLYLISYKVPYLIGPLLFIYCKARQNNKFLLTDLLHLAPFLIAIIPLFSPIAGGMLVWHPYVQAALQLLSIALYCTFALRLLDFKITRLVGVVWFCESVIICTFAIMYIYYPRFPDVRLLFVVLTALIYWISYITISQPDLLLLKNESPIMPLGIQRNNKYSHSSLREEEACRIESGVRNLVEIEKLYLDPALTIDTLAARLNTTKHHLSQVLNERMGKSYLEYVGNLRLDEARRRLLDPSNNRFTIAAIAYDSGFSSVSGFNDSFKKRFNCTPSSFRQHHFNKLSA